MWLVSARRDANLVDGAPETIAGAGVVMAEVRGALTGGGADEDEAQVRLELVGEFFQLRTFLPNRGYRSTRELLMAGEWRKLRDNR